MMVDEEEEEEEAAAAAAAETTKPVRFAVRFLRPWAGAGRPSRWRQ
jgi:hypothetical protein